MHNDKGKKYTQKEKDGLMVTRRLTTNENIPHIKLQTESLGVICQVLLDTW